MKRYNLLLGAALAILAISMPASAADYLGEVTSGLKHSPVYIAPGTQGTDSNTATSLENNHLFTDDNIVLVMLPAAAGAEIGGDIRSFTQNLSQAIGKQYIIGLAIGNDTLGYSTVQPTGEAENEMHLATTTTSNVVDTLGSFVANVHTWQREHPVARKVATTSSPAGIPWYAWAVALIVLFGAGSLLVLRFTTRGKASSQSRTRFKGPEQVTSLLTQIAHQRDRVTDVELQRSLNDICTDLERYFQQYSRNKRADATTFSRHLTSVMSVLTKYIQMQDNPRDYNDRGGKMQTGKQSIQDFAEYVIDSIRRGNDAELLDFNVDTSILQAQRYR